ncbi:hypothetical protein D9611_010861 [Ephemerocybe angulata]|uniref:DNA 3'-5' helicase n=1 Tax=Ephemerocybe angulata TaxID=980116 RepID=A0A8H5FFD0_9AGAR|nr:hypothetical protein D9611_010861 [Tulosesus angulatus]
MAPVFDTPQGRARIAEILAACKPKPIEPHSYQADGIAASLDGMDVLATMATGSGKTGFYTFLMLVIKAISANPSLSLSNITFPKNPAMLVILPTKALQHDMNRSMTEYGLAVNTINEDENILAQEAGRDLWRESIEKYDVILISPELLTSKKFQQLLDHPLFFARVCRFGVDEVHLINTWGKSFRNAFNQIGFMRVRLPSRNQTFTPLIATSATIREGEPKAQICKVLGLEEGKYKLIRRSNMRHDIQLLFREMSSGIGGKVFPELAWVLDSEDRNTHTFGN